jgi:NAD(P)-dependent dehydrogenase (short-subunit alcohol dehydrogenase family)
MDFDDLQGSKRFRVLHAFGATKAANLLFTFALAHRLEGSGITTNPIFPVVTRTNPMHNAPAPIRLSRKAISTSPSEAAEDIIPVATSPEYEAMNGRFFRPGKVVDPPPHTLDQKVQERLGKVSIQLVGQE